MGGIFLRQLCMRTFLSPFCLHLQITAGLDPVGRIQMRTRRTLRGHYNQNLCHALGDRLKVGEVEAVC